MQGSDLNNSSPQSSESKNHSIITGGSSGIGLSIAKKLVARGNNVSLIARDQSRLDEAWSILSALKNNDVQEIGVFSANVSVKSEIDVAVRMAVERFGPPRSLILSAGIVSPGYFEKLPDDAFETDMSVNYFGSLNTVRAALADMAKVDGARIVFISSGAGLAGIFGYSAYAPSKFAIRGLAEVLRAELKEKRIAVSICFPPDTDTPQLHQELKVRPAETSGIAGQAKVWNSDDIAKKIIIGMDKGHYMITPGVEMTLLARLHSLIMPLLFRMFDRAALKFRS